MRWRKHQVLLRRRPPQVEVAVLEARLLGDGAVVLDLERRRLRTRSGRARSAARISISPVGRLGLSVSAGRARTAPRTAMTYSLRSLAGALVRRRAVLGAEHDLDEAGAVAQIDEHDAAVIAPRVHPAHHRHLAADVGRARRAAVDGALPVAEQIERHACVTIPVPASAWLRSAARNSSARRSSAATCRRSRRSAMSRTVT